MDLVFFFLKIVTQMHILVPPILQGMRDLFQVVGVKRAKPADGSAAGKSAPLAGMEGTGGVQCRCPCSLGSPCTGCRWLSFCATHPVSEGMLNR